MIAELSAEVDKLNIQINRIVRDDAARTIEAFRKTESPIWIDDPLADDRYVYIIDPRNKFIFKEEEK